MTGVVTKGLDVTDFDHILTVVTRLDNSVSILGSLEHVVSKIGIGGVLLAARARFVTETAKPVTEPGR